jgi:single-strand selective monofunctional uracil DNA glycosylase
MHSLRLDRTKVGFKGNTRLLARERNDALTKTAEALIEIAQKLVQDLRGLKFSEPVYSVYNPLEYAWPAHEQYLKRFATGPKRVLFLGMNPGPWGMAQTGVPFGEVQAVREFLKIDAKIGKPAQEHPKRPIEGFGCTRSEVSGKRMWGLFQERFGTPKSFFSQHFVTNYCPLVFMDQGARNLTPDKLPAREMGPLSEHCDRHLAEMIRILKPVFLVGVGQFAEVCLTRVCKSYRIRLGDGSGEKGVKILRILHPSPASPAANRGWSTAVEKTLVEQGIWEEKKGERA